LGRAGAGGLMGWTDVVAIIVVVGLYIVLPFPVFLLVV